MHANRIPGPRSPRDRLVSAGGGAPGAYKERLKAGAFGRSFLKAITSAAATALLDVFVGDSGSGGTKGLVPAPAAGDAAAGKFLGADGMYSVPAGSGGAGFHAHKNSSNQTGIADVTPTKVTFTTEVSDAGAYYDAANSRWTPPAGNVMIQGQLVVQGTFAAGVGHAVYLYKNGAADSSIVVYSTVANQVIMPFAFIAAADGDDYFEIYVYIDVSAGTGTVEGSTNNSYFKGAQF